MITDFLIPVLDILDGSVVWARAGERDHYQPIESKLTDSSDPVHLAFAIQQAINAETFYIADLDSLTQSKSPNLAVIENLLTKGFNVWMDAKWASVDPKQIDELTNKVTRRIPSPSSTDSAPRLRPILSSESSSDFKELESEFQRWAHRNPIFSFDLKNGHPIWDGLLPEQIEESQHSRNQINDALKNARRIGFSSAIVLDVGFVGTGVPQVGKHLDQIQAPDGLEIISGGGVNDETDVMTFINAGCAKVLVCTALHRGVW